MSLPDDVERCALLGWRLLPASRASRASMIKTTEDGRAPWEQATADLDQLERWNHRFGPCNWRVVMGGSGIWALDVDAPGDDHEGDGIGALRALTEKHGRLPTGPTTRSGGGGYAIFFRYTGHPITGRTGTPAPGLDPRSVRTTITLPPSIHLRTRKPYRWLVKPWETNPPDAPAWLLEAVRPPPEPPAPVIHRGDADKLARVALDRACRRAIDAASGTGNRTLFASARLMGGWIAAGGIAEGEVAASLFHAARQRGRSDPIEIRETINSGLRSGKRSPMEITA